MFVPCFSIYWQFVAFWGLSKDLNRWRGSGMSMLRTNEGLALAVCILNCCGIVPYAGAVGLAGMIISIIVVKGMCDTAVAILEGFSTSQF